MSPDSSNGDGDDAFETIEVTPEAEAEMTRLAELVIAQRKIRSAEAEYQDILQAAVRHAREEYQRRHPLHPVTCPGCYAQFARELDEAGTVYCPNCGHRFEWRPGRLLPRDPKWQSPM